MHYINLIIISLAIASISYTISKGEIFRSIRLFICKHSKFIGQLISCPYCLSHWVSATIMFIIYKSFNLDFVIMTFAAITLSLFWVGIMVRSFDNLVNSD